MLPLVSMITVVEPFCVYGWEKGSGLKSKKKVY